MSNSVQGARIGLLSDSHGRAEITRRGVRRLLEAGADRLIHLGDVNDCRVFDALVEGVDGAGRVDPPVHVVLGNTDWEVGGLTRYALDLGIAVDHPTGRLEFDETSGGRKTVVYHHGHLREELEKALAEEVDYFCHGHTHERRDERIGPTRVINPGALHRAREYTVALLDVRRDAVEFFTVERRR